MMDDRYGPWALIVGGSDGIGAAFADALAARGIHLVLVARRQAVLHDLARQVRAAHGVEVWTAPIDASTAEAPEQIARTIDGLDVGLLVCNAAAAPVGPFLDMAPGRLDAVLDLNCRLAAHLSHVVGGRLARRGRGGIVLLSSMAGAQGTAQVAHYAATKAYLRVLAEGLWAELRPSGVDVLAVCPGLVATPTFHASRARRATMVPPPVSPESVVKEALAALGRRPVVIPGWRNRLAAAAAQRLLTRRAAVSLASARTRAMYPTESRRSAPAGAPDG